MDFPSEFDKWDFGGYLVRATADYYLLSDARLEAIDRHGETSPQALSLEADWRAHAATFAEQVAAYLVLACGGELRHNHRLRGHPTWGAALLKDRQASWARVSNALRGASHDAVCMPSKKSLKGHLAAGMRVPPRRNTSRSSTGRNAFNMFATPGGGSRNIS